MSKAFEFFEEDARLVEEEAQREIDAQKAFLAREEALTDLDEHLSSLSVEDAQTALEGLREYADTFHKDQPIEQGWHARVD